MKRICVYCGASAGNSPVYRDAAVQLGQLLAEQQIDLVYGGGRLGLMGILAEATMQAGGRVLGVTVNVIRDREESHTGITELYVVSTLSERKAMMAALSDGFIALPGGFGTLDEFTEMLTWAQMGFHQKPCGLLNIDGYYDGLLTFFDQLVEKGFVRPKFRKLVLTANSPQAMLDIMVNHKSIQTDTLLARED